MTPYTVTFIADHFTMNVGVELDLLEPDIHGAGDDELDQVAADLAKNMLQYHYGIDIAKLCDTVETVQG
jgi:hypothetical protein